MLNWDAIPPTQFEKICHDYLCEKYKSYKIERMFHKDQIIQTQQTHDGGRDIEIEYTLYDHTTKIWAECKKYKQKIDLGQLGKHLVLVYNNDVNRFIIFSASDIQENSKLQIIKFLRRLNIGVEIYAGRHLDKELHKYPKILDNYTDGIPGEAAGVEQEYVTTIRLDEYDGRHYPLSETPYRLKKGGAFRISVAIQNLRDDVMAIHGIECRGDDSDFDIATPHLDSPILLTAKEATDFEISFRGRALRHKAQLPPLELKIAAGDGPVLTDRIELGVVDCSLANLSPLVGEDRKQFLHTARQRLKECKRNGTPTFFDVRGKSGTGKSRLLSEVIAEARLSGFRTITADCRGGTGNLMKKIISELVRFPLGRGDLSVSFAELSNYFASEGLKRDHFKRLQNYFETDATDSYTLYSLAEALKHFLVRGPSPVLLAIDNFQDVNVHYLSLFADLLGFFSETEARFIILIATNTEIVKNDSRAQVDGFLEHIDSLLSSSAEYHTPAWVEELTHEEARLFIQNRIRGLHEEDQLLDTLIGKAGKRPLDLEITINYFVDQNVLQGRRDVFWAVKCIEVFRRALKALPSGVRSILDKRFTLLEEGATQQEWTAYSFVFKVLVLFQGEVPLSVLDHFGIDRKHFIRLVEAGFLKYGQLTENFAPYHDNIFLGIKAQDSFSPDSTIATNLLCFLDSEKGQLTPHRDFVRFFCAYHSSLFHRILETGAVGVTGYEQVHDHKRAFEIGKLLTKVLDQQDYGRVNPEEYVRLYITHLRAASRYSNYASAIDAFERLADFVWVNQARMDRELRHRFMHNMVNIHINNGNAQKALMLLRNMQENGVSLPKYEFLLLNRFCVVHTFLGNLREGQLYAQAALEKAEELGDKTLLSIAYSDYGHMHLNLTRDIAAAISMFTKGGELPGNLVAEPDYRQIEIWQQKGFCRFLSGDFNGALSAMETALQMARTMSYVYFEIKLSLSKAACLIELDHPGAESTLVRAKNLCEIFSNDRFRWRTLAMLGTYYLMQREEEVGLEVLELAMELYAKADQDGDLIHKETPWIANALIGYSLMGEGLKRNLVLERFTSEPLVSLNKVLTGCSPIQISSLRLPATGIARKGLYNLLIS